MLTTVCDVLLVCFVGCAVATLFTFIFLEDERGGWKLPSFLAFLAVASAASAGAVNSYRIDRFWEEAVREDRVVLAMYSIGSGYCKATLKDKEGHRETVFVECTTLPGDHITVACMEPGALVDDRTCLVVR